MRSRILAAMPVALSLILLDAAPHRLFAADAKIDISGRWMINEGLSDNPFEKMHGSGRGGGGRGSTGGDDEGGGREGWGRGAGGSYGGMGPGGRAGYPGRGRGRGGDGSRPLDEEFLEETRRLAVVQKDSELRITTVSGRERVFWLDGRKVKEEKDEGTITTKTRRKGSTIVVDTEYPSGRETVETYELLPEIRHLIVTMKVSPPKGRSFTFRRIYDPQDEATSAPAKADPK